MSSSRSCRLRLPTNQIDAQIDFFASSQSLISSFLPSISPISPISPVQPSSSVYTSGLRYTSCPPPPRLRPSLQCPCRLLRTLGLSLMEITDLSRSSSSVRRGKGISVPCSRRARRSSSPATRAHTSPSFVPNPSFAVRPHSVPERHRPSRSFLRACLHVKRCETSGRQGK